MSIKVENQPDGIRLRVNRLTGYLDVTCGARGTVTQLSARNSFSIVVGGREQDVGDITFTNARSLSAPLQRVLLRGRSGSKGFTLDLGVELGEGSPVGISFTILVTNESDETVRYILRQAIAQLPDSELFCPTARGFYSTATQEADVSYRGKWKDSERLVIPMITSYDPVADVGLTVAAHLETPIAPFHFSSASDGEPSIIEREVTVAAGKTGVIRHYYLFHEGCWRPGIGWVRDRFSRFFSLPPEEAAEVHGGVVTARDADKEVFERLAAEGVRNVEIHTTFPHLGKYVPDEEPWIMNADDKWNVIKLTTDPAAPAEDSPSEIILDYMRKVTRPTGTVAAVKETIRRIREAGLLSYIYFQPTESWEFFANAEFPHSILRQADGRPRLTWCDHVQMDCRPETRWGQYLCLQLEGLLRLYPEVDGVFMDQAAEDWPWDDYAVSMITSKLAGIAGRAGKRLYWNGPYQVELAEHTVGFLAESGPGQGELIKYLTVGNKVCCGWGATELQYQRNLVNGFLPSAPTLEHGVQTYGELPLSLGHVEPERRELHDRYMRLFGLYPGKSWVLEPHALQVQGEVEANLFERPDGDYLVPLIRAGASYQDQLAEDDVTVRVTARHTDRIRRVFALVPEVEGAIDVTWEQHAATIEVRLCWFGAACLLVMTSHDDRPTVALPALKPRRQVSDASNRVMIAQVFFEGVFHEGQEEPFRRGLVTTAPLPPIPRRKVFFNGHPATLHTRNYRSWHPLSYVTLEPDVMDYLKEENQLVIEPDGADDFFKLRGAKLTIVKADGTTIESETNPRTYSSCSHELAEGVVGSPIKVRIVVPTDAQRQ